MTAIILIIASMRSAIQWFPCIAHAGYVTFVFQIEDNNTARAFVYVMTDRRRSAHAIDDQNNGGRSQQENHVTRYLVIYLDQWLRLSETESTTGDIGGPMTEWVFFSAWHWDIVLFTHIHL